jgi:ABC-type phosphate transport system substrate-binding protein
LAISQGVAESGTFGKKGLASDCIGRLEGLSIPQLRWIFSSFSDQELINDGWDLNSVAYLDNDPSTHYWSELDANCPDQEIVIAGPQADAGAALLFQELVFGSSSDETFDTSRHGSFFSAVDSSELSTYLAANDTAIAFFDIGFILSEIDLDGLALVSVVVPGEDGEDETLSKPSAASFQDGSYPLARTIRFLLFNDTDSLQNSRGYVEHAFSEIGDLDTKAQGFSPLSSSAKLLMTTRIQSESGIPKEVIESYCGPPGGKISIAGSSTVFPIAKSWAEIYSTHCDVEITVEGGGSSNGAGRACAVSELGTPVDIGDMSREWKDTEAVSLGEDYIYGCVEGDKTRSAIQVDVAIDGVTVAVAQSGQAFECIEIIGGLTSHQLRWIYSNYNDRMLTETGWDPTSLKNSDSNSQTHKWRLVMNQIINTGSVATSRAHFY